MANAEHLEIMQQGVDVWNAWRSMYERVRPDLRDADLNSKDVSGAILRFTDLDRVNLSGAYLRLVDLSFSALSYANLSRANLTGAKLRCANLGGANLVHADLSNSDLSHAHLSKSNLKDAILSYADLSNSDLSHADLSYINLIGANLEGATLSNARIREADLGDANCRGTTLIGADLSDTNLSDADLRDANFSGAKLIGANLGLAKLNGAILRDADCTDIILGFTTFANNNLQEVKGLESVEHRAPSYLSIDTIYRSHGNIPEVFLRGCGVPEDFITYMRSLTTQPIKFYSCFISYSSRDQEFAERLHTDLQAKGVRVWFAPHDLPIGARIRLAIDDSIRLHDKLLLVLSEASVSSQWVEQEVETALAKEREQEGKTVLFPVRIDDSVMEVKSGWPALLRNTRNVGNFTRWKDHDSYQKAFDRLLRDLKARA